MINAEYALFNAVLKWVTSGRFGKDRLEWTADKLLKGAGPGSDPTEIELFDELINIGVVEACTVAIFQTTPATGTFSSAPEHINDNDPVSGAQANAVGQYAEVTLPRAVAISQYRIHSHANNNGTGRWKIQYKAFDDTWVDWETDIPAFDATEWGDWTVVSSKLTKGIRLVCTTVDTAYSKSYVQELEVKY